MRKLFLLIGFPLLALAGYVFYLASDAGEFRRVDDLHPGSCMAIAGVPGPEAITLHPGRNLALISSFDRRAALSRSIRKQAS